MIAWRRWLGLWLVMGLALRVWIAYLYPEGASALAPLDFMLGSVNDAQSFALVAACVALLQLIDPRLGRGALFVMLVLMLVVTVAEIFFWLEFESRLDRLVFHYLAFPMEVLVFLQDQFVLGVALVPVLLLSGLLLRWLSPTSIPAHTGQPMAIALLLLGTLVALVGQPLGQSDSRLRSAFASNGYLGVLHDARFAEDDIAWLTHPAVRPLEAASPVRSAPDKDTDKDKDTDSDAETMAALRATLAGKRHLVMIIEESFAGPVWERETLRKTYLPHFSALARDSLEFTQLYATGSRTTRGLEALLNGFPPLPGISATQRAQVTRLPSLARGLQAGGFYPVFLYGGWPNFSNFHTYWKAMGFRQMWPREEFDEPFEPSWGVADGGLLQRLVTEMDVLTQAHERVFLATLTVSHHRPFDFPEGEVAFPATARRSEYAMAYADHALGEFFAAARQSPWYNDTLFLIVADHGLYPRGDALIPVQSYRIPLLLHGEGIAPRTFDHQGSSMSVPRTLVNLFGIDTVEAFAGGDLLCDCDTPVPLEAGYHVGMLQGPRLHVVTRDGEYRAWDQARSAYGGLAPVAAARLAPDARGAAAVIDTFAWAYRWLYGDTAAARLPGAADALAAE